MQKIELMRFAGMNLNYTYYPFEFFLDAIAENGLTNIELWAASPHFYVEDITVQEIAALRKQLAERNLSLVCYTPDTIFYPINIASTDKKLRSRSIEYCKKNITAASLLEAPYILITAGRGYYNKSIDEAWKLSAESLNILAEYAKKEGIVLLLEALQYAESNLVTSLDGIEKMLAEVSSEHIQTMIDTVQLVVAGDTIDSYFERLGSRVRHIHFTEGKPAGHLTWGDGNLPMKELLEEIERSNYSGALTLEIGPYLLDPNEALNRGLKCICKELNISK